MFALTERFAKEKVGNRLPPGYDSGSGRVKRHLMVLGEDSVRTSSAGAETFTR